MNHLSETIETIKIISSKYFPGNFIIHLDVCCDCGQLLSFISTVHMTPKYSKNCSFYTMLVWKTVRTSTYAWLYKTILFNQFLVPSEKYEGVFVTDKDKIIIWLIIKCNDRKSNNNLKISYCALGMISSNKRGV